MFQEFLEAPYVVRRDDTPTPQEIYDRVAQHLITQGQRAAYGVSCIYHASNGDKCAIGVLISDEAYLPEMEGLTAYSLIRRHGKGLPSWFQANIDLLEDLQEVHDHKSSWYDIRETLRVFAVKHGFRPYGEV